MFVHAEEELTHTAMEPHAIADPFRTTRAVTQSMLTLHVSEHAHPAPQHYSDTCSTQSMLTLPAMPAMPVSTS